MIAVEQLQPGEITRYESGASSRLLVPPILATILLGFIPFVGWFFLGPFFAVWTIWNLFSNIRSRSYLITNQRIIVEKKFFRKNQKIIQLQNISDVQIHQGIFGRLLDYGIVVPIPMSGSGIGNRVKELALIGVRTPTAVSETINQLVREAQLSRQKADFDSTEKEIVKRRLGLS